MVCRENKARSAMMGYAKAIQLHNGKDAFNDAEVQSMIHAAKHDGDALNQEHPLTKEEQVDLLERVRADIKDNPHISDSEKYRKSKQRPGMVTRIDQELERLKTGKTESGKELTNAQRNDHAHIYAMMRMGQMAERIVPAKQQFLETNARHRGIEFEEAKAEWDELMNREGRFDQKSQIRDDVRNSLATAGVSSEMQLNLGVSGKAIDAMETMEARRRGAIAQLQTRAAVTEKETVGKYLSPTDPKAQKKCTNCGQFGHDASECPNVHLTNQREQMVEGDGAYLNTAQKLLHNERLLTASDEDIAADPAVAEELKDGNLTVDQWRTNSEAELQAAKDNGEYMDQDIYDSARRRYERDLARIDAKIAEGHPKVSATVSEVRYNKDSGVLVAFHHPTEENPTPAPTIRRCTPEEKDAVVAQISKEPMGQVFDTNLTEDHHKFANEEDAKAALTLQRCPTCGQWASLNSGHQCPVPGGPSEELENDRRRRRIKQQQARREGTTRPLTSEVMLETVSGQRRKFEPRHSGIKDGIVVNYYKHGASKSVVDSADSGKVANPYTEFAFADGKVQGRVSVWQNREDGARVMSVHNTGIEDSGLRCDCAEYKARGWCKHMRATSNILANTYRAHPAPDGALPGEAMKVQKTKRGSRLTIQGREAPDVLEMDSERAGLDRLLEIRAARQEAEHESYRNNRADGQGATTLMVQGPTDNEGNPKDWPTQWTPARTLDNGTERSAQALRKTTDLSNRSAVADRLRTTLSNVKATMPDGSVERLRFAARAKDVPNGVVVDIPRHLRKASPARQEVARKALADRLGINVRSIGPDGFHIPGNTAHYAEFLDRAAQNVTTARTRGPRSFVEAEPTRWVDEDGRKIRRNV